MLRRVGPEAIVRFGLDDVRTHALRNVAQCRTAALGGHLAVCTSCAAVHPRYNSCRNRHCPQCQGMRRREWAVQQTERMLPVPHFMVVFTLPGALRPLAAANPGLVYDAVLVAASDTLAALARRKYNGRVGVTAVLHTWNREMGYHVHVHALVSAAVLAGDDVVRIDEDWLFHRRRLSRAFRHRVMQSLAKAHADGRLDTGKWSFATWRQKAHKQDWHVGVEPPRGRHRADVVRYLARYVYSVAISDSRVLDVTANTVVIATRAGQKLRLDKPEFVRRWSLHVLPPGFRKVRHTGLYAPAAGALRERARSLLPAEPPPPPSSPQQPPDAPVSVEVPSRPCPSCGAPLITVAVEHLALVLRLLARTSNRARGPP